MGLIKQLVLLPVAPVRFTVWVAEQVDAEASRRERGPGAAIEQIEAAEEARERGEIDREEADRRQGEALERQLGAPGAGPAVDPAAAPADAREADDG